MSPVTQYIYDGTKWRTEVTSKRFSSATAAIPTIGLRGWWRADAITSAPTNGANFTRAWTNSSVGGEPLTTAGATPTRYWSSSTFLPNGKPVIQFTAAGNQDMLSNIPNNTASTKLLVVRLTSFLGSGSSVFGGQGGYQLIVGPAGKLDLSASNKPLVVNTGTTKGATLSLNRWVVLAMTANGTNSSATFVNGTLDATSTTAYSVTGKFCVVGSNSGSQFLNGYVAEVIDYSRVLSSSELSQVTSYLTTKFQIQSTVSGPSAYWSADFEEGPSAGIAGYSDFSFAQAEDPLQADPGNNEIGLASSYGITAHSGRCVAKFTGVKSDNDVNLYHNKVYKEWQVGGSIKRDSFNRNLQPVHPSSGISGTYRAWFRVPANYTFSGWSNIFQWKLTEQSPFAQTPQWWVTIKDKNNAGGPASVLHVSHWNNANYTNPGGDRDLPLNQWFEIRADLYEGNRIDWYLNGTAWQSVSDSTHGIGRKKLEVGGTPQTWVFGVGHYGGVGTIYVDDCSFTPR